MKISAGIRHNKILFLHNQSESQPFPTLHLLGRTNHLGGRKSCDSVPGGGGLSSETGGIVWSVIYVWKL